MRVVPNGVCMGSVLLLAACGGDGPVPGAMEDPFPPLKALGTVSDPDQVKLRVLSADSTIHEAVRGVVTSGRSTAIGTWDGQVIGIIIPFGAGYRAMTSTDHATNGPTTIESPVRGAGHQLTTVGVGGTSGDVHALGRLSVDWASDDPTNYLAGGHWIVVDLSDPEMPVASAGASLDGPMLDSAPDVRTTGLATYTGRAGGLHTVIYSDGWFAAGEFDANITLEADFDAMEISGLIDDIYSTEEGIFEGELESYERSTRPYALVLGTAPIDGTTFAGDVDVTTPADNIASSTGRWDGQFIGEGTVGTFGSTWVHDSGTEGQYIGTFFATE